LLLLHTLHLQSLLLPLIYVTILCYNTYNT